MTSALLEVESLRAWYPDGPVVLDGVSMSLREGECLGLIGRNGAGKSTLAKCALQLGPHWEGAIRFMGADTRRLGAAALVRRGLSVMPQGENVFPYLTVAENLRLQPGYMPTDEHEIEQRFPALSAKMDQVAATLSGGERQMIALLRCVLSRPKAVILDEPTANLSEAALQLLEEILSDWLRGGVGVLIVEHNLSFLERVATRLCGMERGKLAIELNRSEFGRESEAVLSRFFGLEPRTNT